MWLLLIACGTAPQPISEAAPLDPPAPVEVDSAQLRAHMHEHLSKATIAYEALIHGDMKGAREALAWLGEHDAPTLPDGAEPFVGRMRDLAAKGAVAPQYDEVAAQIAEMGAACGACHQAQQVNPTLELGEPPASSGDVHAHMARHQWAVQALWTGLVVPADGPWAAGVQALSDDHLDDKAFEVPELSEQAKTQGRAVHTVARGAAMLTTRQDRAKAFATIATACAGCHAEMRGE